MEPVAPIDYLRDYYYRQSVQLKMDYDVYTGNTWSSVQIDDFGFMAVDDFAEVQPDSHYLSDTEVEAFADWVKAK